MDFIVPRIRIKLEKTVTEKCLFPPITSVKHTQVYISKRQCTNLPFLARGDLRIDLAESYK